MRETSPILSAGHNCWQQARAERLAVFDDSASFFEAAADAFECARHTVLIVGWDFHSRVRLRRRQDDGRDLLDLLVGRAREHPELQVRVLIWDEDVIYSLEREMMQRLRFWRRAPPNVQFCHDATAPTGTAHHQKLIAVDGGLGFVGGVDIAQRRWDTSQHRVDDPRRKTPNRLPFGPFHDTHTLVDGEAAELVLEMARWRWRHRTGEAIEAAAGAEACWPAWLSPDFEQVDVALARTLPTWLAEPDVREVEQLFVDSFRAARDVIYLENQYLSSTKLVSLLAERLGEDDAPEVIIVLPRHAAGLIEESTMGVLRSRMVRRLRQADRGGRLRVVYPVVEQQGKRCEIYVHAKVCIIDDRLLRVGSANLTNRSMGVDSECDLVLEARDDAQQRGIRQVRNRLVGHLVGLGADAVAARLDQVGSLGALVDGADHGPHRLERLEPAYSEQTAEVWGEEALMDPYDPLDAEKLAERLLPESVRQNRATHARVALVLGLLLLLAVTWHWTPLGQWLDPRALADAVKPLAKLWWAGPVATLGFVLLSVLAFPVTVLILATGFVFGAWWGTISAIVGSMLSAVVSYWLGDRMGASAVDKLASGNLRRIHKWISERGVWSVVVVHLIPVAPFGVINLAVGASEIPFRDFMWGTFIAMVPGIILKGLFGGQLADFMAHPDPLRLVILGAIIAVFVGAGAFISRWVRGKAEAKEVVSDPPPEAPAAPLDAAET